MTGPLSRWLFSRVVKSALVFETESIETYRRLQEGLEGGRSCGGHLAGSLCHLLEEERQHWEILSRASVGKLGVEELEKVLDGHMYAAIGAIRPLEGEDLARWAGELSKALAQEEKTYIFYSNLRRMSKIPVVKRAFEVLAHMEKEHIDILRALLGRAAPPASGAPSPGSWGVPGAS
jgi:rubrerythrin